MAWREDCDLGVVRIRELTVSSGISGDITGDVTGNVTGNVTGDVTGNVTGGVTGDVTGDVTGAITLPSAAVAELPDATANEGMLVVCSDGAAGSPCLAYSNGTNWLQIALGSAVSAT
jgi:hypothetical protein